jgi:hypothetical protein
MARIRGTQQDRVWSREWRKMGGPSIRPSTFNDGVPTTGKEKPTIRFPFVGTNQPGISYKFKLKDVEQFLSLLNDPVRNQKFTAFASASPR